MARPPLLFAAVAASATAATSAVAAAPWAAAAGLDGAGTCAEGDDAASLLALVSRAYLRTVRAGQAVSPTALPVAAQAAAWTAPPGAGDSPGIHVGVRGGRATLICILLGVVNSVALGYLFGLWWRHGLLAHLLGARVLARSAPAAGALTWYLVLIVGIDLMVKKEAEAGGNHFRTSPLLIVPLVEGGKLLVSLVLYGLSRLTEPSSPHHWEGAWAVGKLMLPVAVLFMFTNSFSFIVIARLNLDARAAWQNSNIIFSALLWVWVMNRRIALHGWVGVCLCMCSACFNSIQHDGTVSADRGAVLGQLLICFLSALSSVWNEEVLKCPAASHLDINQVGILLYSQCLMVMLIASIFILGHTQELAGSVTPGAWMIIVAQIAQGISVSRVIKFADTVSKSMVCSTSNVVLVVLAPHIVHGTRLDLISIGSACLACTGGMIYATPTVDEVKA